MSTITPAWVEPASQTESLQAATVRSADLEEPSSTLIIEAGREATQYWLDLWRGRELLGFMIWRDILVRYKQTLAGVAWSVLRPMMTMLAGTFIFQFVLRTGGIEGVPYPVVVYLAILPWQFFSDALSGISLSLTGNSGLLTKIYFPRLMIPLSRLAVGLVDFLISCAVLALIMAWYRFVPGPRVMLLPLFALLACAASLGMGLWLAALNVKYRDVMYIVPFILQFGAYVSPVFFPTERIYSSQVLPEWAKFAYALNPMVSVIDGFRWCVLGPGQVPMHWDAVGGSIALTALFVLIGVRYFRKTEATFADVI
jgi:lipopolysaccharide transport system permease protein